MNRRGAAQIMLARNFEPVGVDAKAPVSPTLLRNWIGRVQEALLRGVRLRDSIQPQATPQLEMLANELESVVEQIRCALAGGVETSSSL